MLYKEFADRKQQNSKPQLPSKKEVSEHGMEGEVLCVSEDGCTNPCVLEKQIENSNKNTLITIAIQKSIQRERERERAYRVNVLMDEGNVGSALTAEDEADVWSLIVSNHFSSSFFINQTSSKSRIFFQYQKDNTTN